ncbi:STAS domain-containing protein [Kutzneria sp. NPDC051319]|uniref:STAS domain-containing protein n=1 Tax=Kutzneria sp. NPDC051319 TaxID=3155047 RepID=UPI003429344D
MTLDVLATSRVVRMPPPLDVVVKHLEVVVEHVETVPIVHLVGEVDLASVGLAARPIRQELASAPPTMVVDLSPVTFFSASGLTLLVQTRAAAGRAQTDVQVVAGQPAVLRPLALTGLANVFDMYSTVDCALRAVGLAA